jgi:cytochrome P450 family 144
MRAPEYSQDPGLILSPAVIANPQPFYAKLRKTQPLTRIGETGVHLVLSWTLVEEALGREQDFSANLTGVVMRGRDGGPSVFELGNIEATQVIATADEPHHSVHRTLLQPRLTPARIDRMEPLIRGWVDAALTPWLARGGGDFVPIAERIPARAIAHLLGLPDRDVERFRVWAMMGGDMLAGDADAARLQFLTEETARMLAYLGEHIDEADAASADQPDATLLAALARGVAEGRIARGTAMGISSVLFGAAGESTAALIGSCLYWLARDPALAQTLRTSRDLIPRFVEEIVRLDPPFNFHYRAVRRACRFGGYDLEAGDRLMLSWASANRDEAIFEDPDSLRLDRRFPKNHVGFGRGLHFCIGAHLARLEARLVVETTLARTKHLALDPVKPVRHAHSIFIRRPEQLPLVATAAPERAAGVTSA